MRGEPSPSREGLGTEGRAEEASEELGLSRKEKARNLVFWELGIPPWLKASSYANSKRGNGSENLQDLAEMPHTHTQTSKGPRVPHQNRSKEEFKENYCPESVTLKWCRRDPKALHKEVGMRSPRGWSGRALDISRGVQGRGRGTRRLGWDRAYTHRADLQRQGALQRLHLRHPRRVVRRGRDPGLRPECSGKTRGGTGTGRRWGDGGGGSCGPQAGARGPAWVPPEQQLSAGRGLVVMAARRGGAGRNAQGRGMPDREAEGGASDGARWLFCDVKLWAQTGRKGNNYDLSSGLRVLGFMVRAPWGSGVNLGPQLPQLCYS